MTEQVSVQVMWEDLARNYRKLDLAVMDRDLTKIAKRAAAVADIATQIQLVAEGDEHEGGPDYSKPMPGWA